MDIVMPRRLHSAFDLSLWPAVRAHRVQGYDAWHGVSALAGFLDFENFSTFVVATLGAGPMRHLALVAVGTFRECVAFQRVMGAPASGTRFRVSPFWIWHFRFPFRIHGGVRDAAFRDQTTDQSSNLLRKSLSGVQRGSSIGSAQAHR